MKKPYLLLLIFLFSISTKAQEPAKKSGVVKTAEKVNQGSQKISEASNQVANEGQQIAGNAQNVVTNAKAIIKIFEPILRFRLKKVNAENNSGSGATENNPDPNTGNTNQQSGNTEETQTGNTGDMVTQQDIAANVPLVAESPTYNTDGSGNLGNQNHKQFGCYIDIQKGAIMDEIDAAGLSGSVDLIFTATNAFNEQVPMYAFLTPSFVKHDAFAYNFFKGAKYKDRNIPPAAWDEVNESEVALSSITGAQFEKINNNNQLMAVVKQIKGFGQKVESRTKLDGKVIAVKTEMGNRTAYGLIYIMNHYGTTGENGYLKIRLKVTGFDANGDGTPDANLY